MNETQHTVLQMWNHVMLYGRESSPRGLKIKEIDQYRIEVINPWSTYPARNYPMDYFKAEAQWYLNADPYDDRIFKHASMWKKIAQEDGRIFSNYGHYWFNPVLPDYEDPFSWVIHCLYEDPDSRQAVIPMCGREHLFEGNKDVVCTKCIQFRIINGKLNMHVDMRSSDAVFGIGTDWPCFSMLQEMVALGLSIPVGKFIFSSDSLHIYEKHWNMVIRAMHDGEDAFMVPVVPHIDSIDDLLHGTMVSPYGKWLTQVKL